jgi:NTP pyrophosphatase (non-canonical NTP hydrolase)
MSFDLASEGRMGRVFDVIYGERVRQQRLKEEGRFLYTCADTIGLTPSQKYVVLAEECGEVARVLLNLNALATDFKVENRSAEAHHAALAVMLKKELIEVAAVAVAWLESLEQEKEPDHGKKSDEAHG